MAPNKMAEFNFTEEELMKDMDESLDDSSITQEEQEARNHSRRTSFSSTLSTTKLSLGLRGKDIRQQSENVKKNSRGTILAAFLLVVGGIAASVGFVYMGITSEKQSQQDNFERQASDIAREVELAWYDYETAALWIHESCRNWRTNEKFTYLDFEILYKYISSRGLEFREMQWVPNVTHAERPFVEALGGLGWNMVLPEDQPYQGFIGQEPDPENHGNLMMAPRSNQPFYFPVHFGEPRAAAAAIAGYDLFSPPWERPAILRALDTHEPALTGGFQLVGDTSESGYSVVLYHPGAQLQEYGIKPKDLSTMVINAKDLLMRAVRIPSASLAVYLFDATDVAASDSEDEETEPAFLAGLEVHMDETDGTEEHVSVAETNMSDIESPSALYFTSNLQVAGRVWKVIVVPVDDTFDTSVAFVVLSGFLILLASILLAVWMVHGSLRALQMHHVITEAAAEAAIVADMYPEKVRKRMIEDAKVRKKKEDMAASNRDVFRNDKGGGGQLSSSRLDNFLTSEGVYGSKPIADFFPYTTIMFCDLVGFSAWSSTREPASVFSLLEVVYHSFDVIAKQRRVFKVETVGDCYVASCGLPESRDDHAVVMARFATDCNYRLQKLCKALERTLGPDTGDLACRIGLHSGPVVGGVLRGDRGRFQLFGDTINMASRMESTGVSGKIQISTETADLLIQARKEKWIVPREGDVHVKGKGTLKTFFVEIYPQSKPLQDEIPTEVGGSPVSEGASDASHDGKVERLVEWNVEIFTNILRRIVAKRKSTKIRRASYQAQKESSPWQATSSMMFERSSSLRLLNTGTPLEEVAEIIELPDCSLHKTAKSVDPDSILLDPEVVAQLSDLVTKIASMYRSNPFHNFEHASHVTMSVIKMMGRIVDPRAIAKKQDEENELHNRIAMDPLTQFACAFSALVHDLDHEGVTNTTLIAEESPLAKKYNSKSVAEQNSLDLAWELLLKSDYQKLRACLCRDNVEFSRLRSLVVNSVMSTDIMDKDLGAARKARWNTAFCEQSAEESQAKINRKATIIIEHLIQASDVSHTMQHWAIYVKWNERLFHEMYRAFKAGRIDKDPSEGWYEGELGFFDYYIIPLAKKLFTCGVFGVSSDELLDYALSNRKEWEKKGSRMVERYLESYNNNNGEARLGDSLVFGDDDADSKSHMTSFSGLSFGLNGLDFD